MEILNRALEQIKEHRHSKSSEVLAGAVLSACGRSNDAFSLLSVSVSLDCEGKAIVMGLLNIAQQPDFSNSDQNNAIAAIEELMPHIV